MFFWLFIGFAILTGTSVWWFINNENTKEFAINQANNVTKGENYKIKQSINNSPKRLYKVQKAQSARSIAFLKKGDIKKC
ncbi:MAG: hypothetical protein WKG06_15320 [Segetibacter sp.]